MRKFIRDILANLIANILLAVGGIVVIILAYLESLPTYQLVLLIIGTIGLVLWVVNQITIWRERQEKLSKLSDKEIENTIRDWLTQSTYKFQRKDDPNCLFLFVLTAYDERPVIISRTKEKPTALGLSTSVTLDTRGRKAFENIDNYEKQKLVYDLRIEMARYGIGYEIGKDLEKNILTDVILLDDSLNEFSLYLRIFYVTGAVALFGEVLQKSLITIGEQGKHKEDSQH